MPTIYDMLELDGLPGSGDVLGVPGTGADVEFLMTETTADVPDEYYSSALGQNVGGGFNLGSVGTFPTTIDGSSYSTSGLYDITYDLDGTTYSGFIVEAVPVGGGASRFFFLPQDGISPLAINQLEILSMTSVTFVDADDAATDDTITFVVCFAAGTQMATPHGPRPVESLKEGDLVTTLDQGDQPILWLAETQVSQSKLAQNDHLRAIEIGQGAIGDDMPRRALRVSRQHRVLIKSPIAQRMLDTDQVLIAAKDLLGLPGIRLAKADGDLGYVHILLPCHSVLLADGVGAESLWLGEEATRSLGTRAVTQARHRLFVPQAPAHPFLSGHQAKKLVQRLVDNRRRLWEAPPPQVGYPDCKDLAFQYGHV